VTTPRTPPSEESQSSERRIVLVEYFIIEDTVFVFCVGSEFRQPTVAKLPLNLSELRLFVLANFGRASKVLELVETGFEELWHAYDYLIEPIARWTRADDIICVVPHGWLHYLPLHALKIGGQYLIERNAVLYLPSASVLKYCQAKRKKNPDCTPARRRALVFGDSRGDLPFSRIEAQNVAAIFGVESWLGDAVTFDAFRRGIDGADIVHFAGHGYFDGAQALESGLRLAGQELLTAREVFALKGLSAHLVALSGCETGVNESRPGDELIGLTRAFLYAGTPSVLVTLWRVADDSTAFLMKRFYELIRECATGYKVDALRQAILDTKAQPRWGSFYYWAPFVLVGDWQ
jgi:CHAT domain-containing protein